MLVLSYHMLFFTSFVERNDFQFMMGFSYVGCMCAILLVNMIYMISKQFDRVKAFFVKRRNQILYEVSFNAFKEMEQQSYIGRTAIISETYFKRKQESGIEPPEPPKRFKTLGRMSTRVDLIRLETVNEEAEEADFSDNCTQLDKNQGGNTLLFDDQAGPLEESYEYYEESNEKQSPIAKVTTLAHEFPDVTIEEDEDCQLIKMNSVRKERPGSSITIRSCEKSKRNSIMLEAVDERQGTALGKVSDHIKVEKEIVNECLEEGCLSHLEAPKLAPDLSKSY